MPYRQRARVVVVTGPSGSGKSRLAGRMQARFGWLVVRLDDFYRDGDDPDLPLSSLGIPDWDDPRSWRSADALTALQTLIDHGTATVPDYDISTSRAVGSREISCGPEDLIIAEGLFAAELIEPLGEAGLLADAYCICHNRWVTFARRLVRDLCEHRKPPHILVRRGLILAGQEPRVVGADLARGARRATPNRAERELTSRYGHA